MNIKKTAITLAAAAAMLASAVPALASHTSGHTDVAIVSNSSTAVADTGMNSQNNTAKGWGSDVWSGGSRTMTTGNAKADSKAVVIANTHVGDCACSKKGKDVAIVGNTSSAGAFTGSNEQDDTAKYGGDVVSWGSRTMTTGNARSDSDAWVVVNTHWGM